jgi:hypothetical protein
MSHSHPPHNPLRPSRRNRACNPVSYSFRNCSINRRDPVVDAMIEMVRLAVDRAWTVASATRVLRERVPDAAVLYRVRSNVSKMLVESPSEIIERAAVIVDGALTLGVPENSAVDHVASCGWPYDSPCPRCYPLSLTI